MKGIETHNTYITYSINTRISNLGAPRRSTSRLSQRCVALLRNPEKQKKKEERKKQEVEKRKRKPIDVCFLKVRRGTCTSVLVRRTYPLTHHHYSLCFQINVQLLTGRSITVSVSPNDTIEELTLKILVKEGINPDQQSLLYSGLRLHEVDTVDDCHIQEQSRLFLTLRLRGG
jgi:hypothetical protein